MNKKEIEIEILKINDKFKYEENRKYNVIEEIFKKGLDQENLENYNGIDPLDTVINTVIDIIRED